jgi:hypothetical protein
MDGFSKFYCWSLQMKLRMGIYALALILCKMAWNAIEGVYTVRSLDLLTMWLAAMAFAVVEMLLLPDGAERTTGRVALWVVSGNVLIWGGSVLLGWFRGIPVWGGAILVVLLEMSLAAMWYGDRLRMQKDSANLNRQLKEYQQRKEQTEL